MQDPANPELRQPDASVAELRAQIEAIVGDRALLQKGHARAVREVVFRLDQGELRVAERTAAPDRWLVHGWIQQSISFYFAIAHIEAYQAGDLEFHDKVPPKHGLAAAGIRVVPPGVVRYGAHVEKGAIVMPGYVNIGARVGAGTMVDTWATVGSCAQVGSNVHLSGGVGLGGVLEPPGAAPVIVEDGAFIGSRGIVVEGVLVGEEAVLGANVTLTASTQIIDVSGPEERIYRGHVPPRSVVIPGMREKRFPSGTYQVPCALIIGQRSASTDKKTSLNAALRDFAVAV